MTKESESSIPQEFPHPGKIIRKELFRGKRILSRVAKEIGVQRTTLSHLVNGTSDLSLEMAVKLARRFSKFSAEELLLFQIRYDLSKFGQQKDSLVGTTSIDDGTPLHPGEIIRREILEPRNLKIQQMANIIGVRRNSLSRVLNGGYALSPELALRISRHFNQFTAREMLGFQADFDLRNTQQKLMAIEDSNPELI